MGESHWVHSLLTSAPGSQIIGLSARRTMKSRTARVLESSAARHESLGSFTLIYYKWRKAPAGLVLPSGDSRRQSTCHFPGPCSELAGPAALEATMRIAQIAPLYESVPPKLYG